MSGKIAGSLCPFDGRLTIGLTIGTRFVYHHSITPFAGLHGGITSPTVVGTAVLLHEDALRSHFCSLTNHGDLSPFSMDYVSKLKAIEMISVFFFANGHKKKSYKI